MAREISIVPDPPPRICEFCRSRFDCWCVRHSKIIHPDGECACFQPAHHYDQSKNKEKKNG